MRERKCEFTHRQLLALNRAVFLVTIGDHLAAGATRIFETGFVAVAGGHKAARVATQSCAQRIETSSRECMQTFSQLYLVRGTFKLKSVLPFAG